MNRVLSGRKYVVGAVIVIIALIFLIKLFFIQVLDNKDGSVSAYVSFQPVVYDKNGNEAENIVPYRLQNIPIIQFRCWTVIII